MEKKEVLEKVQQKKAIVGEMEKSNINKSNWIALICASVVAVIFMIIEGALGHFSTLYAIGVLFCIWAGVFYICQYFVAKRKYVGIIIGVVLEFLGATIFLVFYILYSAGIL